jgi:hypothetical protein
MKKTPLTILLIFNVLISTAQVQTDYKSNDSIFIDQSYILTSSKIPLPRDFELYLVNTILDKLKYSELLFENGIQGSVTVACKINSKGHFGYGKKDVKQFKNGTFEILKLLKPQTLGK